MVGQSSPVVESPEPTKDRKGNSQGFSIGKPSEKSKGVESGPHYLRSSSGSCHDVCKYGKAHEFEKKPRRPVSRRLNAEIPVEILIPDEKKSVKEVKPSKPNAAASHPPSHDVSVSAKQENLVPTKFRSSGPSKSIGQGTTSQIKPPLSTASKSAKKELPLPEKLSLLNSSKLIKQGASSAVRSCSPVIKPIASSSLRSPLANKASKLIKLEGPVPAHRKTFSPDASDSIKPSGVKSMKSTSHESSRSSSGYLKSKSRPVIVKQSPSAYPTGRPSLKGVIVAGNSESKISYSPSIPSTATKKTLAPAKSCSSPRAKKVSPVVVKRVLSSSAVTSTPKLPMPKLASMNVTKKMTQNNESQKGEDTSKDQNSTENSGAKELGNEKAPEKTLHVIKGETDCQTPVSAEDGANIIQSQLVLSPGSLNSISHSNSPSFSSNDVVLPKTESEYTDDGEADDSFSDYDDDGDGDGINIVDGINHGKPRNSRMIVSEENESAPVKLKFKRGKIVELQTDTDAPPRRLRFRRRKALINDQGASDGSHRSFKAGSDTGKPTDSDPVGESVVLRHQDKQAMKNDQGLFNNVIEETANKLVETRKSKVMALVGAFETVIISLQERKSSGDRSSPQSSPER